MFVHLIECEIDSLQMMVPFANNGHLTAAQLNFNRKLSQGRVRVENAYALAKGKWRRLKFMHVRRQDILVDHITACFVLHNFIILHGEPMIDVSGHLIMIAAPVVHVIISMTSNEFFFSVDRKMICKYLSTMPRS